MTYITEHRGRFGVEPICTVLQIAPATYYAAVDREPSIRALHDGVLQGEITRVWNENRQVYGAYKVWRQLRREGWQVARCTVERLMRDLVLRGNIKGKSPRTTWPAAVSERPADLVDRKFTASAPNQLWVGDLTYVKTHSGWVYVAFVNRRLLAPRGRLAGIPHPCAPTWRSTRWRWRCGRGGARYSTSYCLSSQQRPVLLRPLEPGQYLSIRYTERLAEAGINASVGSRGDSYDNAAAESFNSLYKSELIHKRGPWTGLEHVEHATLDYVDWFNNCRLHRMIGDVPPAEYEARTTISATGRVWLRRLSWASLYETRGGSGRWPGLAVIATPRFMRLATTRCGAGRGRRHISARR